MMSSILSKFRAWNLYRETVRELSGLTDRELADVGISRWEIHSVARKSAFSASIGILNGRDKRPSAIGAKPPFFHNGHAAA